MGAIIGFIVRLVGYALLIGIPGRIAEFFWQRAALDGVEALRPAHDAVTAVGMIIPILLAFFGFGRLRNAAVFIALYIVGAALTAPFAFARFVAAGG